MLDMASNQKYPMNRIFTSLVVLSFALSIVSCAYHVEDELYPPDVCDTINVTYSGTIAGIIMTQCFDCHDAQALESGIPLEGYTNLKSMVDANRLIGALRHLNGFSPMPKDRGFLPECEILQIEKWVANGAPNN